MFSIAIDIAPDDYDMVIAELWEQGSAGIVEIDSRRLRAFFDDDADRDALRSRYPNAAWRDEEQRDWIEAARERLPPMLVGERFFLVPEWRDDPTPAGRFRIAINPGMAFGTGFHESTQLCLEALEDVVRPGRPLLDVGTGSGILAQAAALLGAAPVYACDNDPIALGIARSHLAHAFVGSADAVRAAAADVVVANIVPEVIAAIASDLMRVRKPGGTLLLSGIESHEIDALRAALPPIREVRRKGSWALFIL